MALLEDVILRGDRASQPAANTVGAGTLYCVTDEGDIIERSTGAAWQSYSPSAGGSATRAIVLAIDGGGSAITTGIKADVYVPYAATITAVTMLADQSGSIVVDIWKDTYANYPPTVADTITASAKPTITTATKSQDTTLTGWTTAISAGDTLRFNVDSASTITRLHLALTVTA
jgi:hypothetical protein